MLVGPTNSKMPGYPARMARVWGIALSFWLFSASLCAADSVPIEKLEVADVNGLAVRPFEAKQQKATLLFFTTHDCPIANAYAPEIKRICETYESKGVRIFLVHVDLDLSAENAKKHAAEFGFTCPVLPCPIRFRRRMILPKHWPELKSF